MIKAKFYTDKEGRDPNVYLGIDENPIPFEYFKGIYSNSGEVFTDDAFHGVQFIISEDSKSVSIVGMNPDEYVTKEDIQSTDKWFIIYHKLGEINEGFNPFTESNWYSITQSDVRPQYEEIIKRYHSGETGPLMTKYKDYNDKGEYMYRNFGFDNQSYLDEDIRSTLRRHISFVYSLNPDLPWEERVMKVKGKNIKIMELTKLLMDFQLKALSETGLLQLQAAENQDDKTNFIIAPGMGKLILLEDETVEDFLVTKIDK